MWLQDRDERKLIKILYLRAYSLLQRGNSPVEPIQYTNRDLVAAFRPKAAVENNYKFDSRVGRVVNEKELRYFACINKIYALIVMLEKRSLLKLLEGQTTTEDGTKFRHGSAIVFSLTPIGYDLGAKYDSRLKCVHLFWLEYKDSFLWPIIGFLFGSIMTYILLKVTSKP